jgi:hypothetical protein
MASKASRHRHGPYLQPPNLSPADEAVIAPGGAIRASWDLRGGHGTKIEIANVGSASCEFAGHRLTAGKIAEVSVRDGTREFALEIDSPSGTRVRLTVVAWRAPTYILAKRREIERDPKTHTISAITEVPTWVLEEPR